MLTQFLNISGESIQKAATAIRSGGLVVYPTDTVYGLGCDPFDEKAVNRVATVKGRSKGNFPVLVDTLSRAVAVLAGSTNHRSCISFETPSPSIWS